MDTNGRVQERSQEFEQLLVNSYYCTLNRKAISKNIPTLLQIFKLFTNSISFNVRKYIFA